MAVKKKPHALNNAAPKKRKRKPSAFRGPGVWMTDEFTGEKFLLRVNPPVRGGKIPLAVIRDSVRKVIGERLKREAEATQKR
jgi:hypothetical protein